MQDMSKSFLALTLLTLLLFLSACSGIGGPFCKATHENPDVAAMMRDSCQGDRMATLHLGLWFEGEGDYAEAARYYRAAAADSSGQTYVYVPEAGDVPGYTIPVDSAPKVPGLAEAKYRLALLYISGKGVKESERKARDLLMQASEQGHKGAADMLAGMPAH